MSDKRKRVQDMLREPGQAGFDAHYVEYFARFNSGEYFEAHDVLEQLWLIDRNGPNGRFYKGLIQLAGAFVHVRKHRTGPALALLKLAEDNLSGYPGTHEGLILGLVSRLIADWRELLGKTSAGELSTLVQSAPPRLKLEPGSDAEGGDPPAPMES